MTKTRDLANLADLNFDSGTMVVDKVNDRVGVGTSSPSAKAHIQTASSGSPVAASGDELFVEGSGDAGITVGAGNTSKASLFFADNGDSAAGRIRYDHSDNSMQFGTNGQAERLRIDSSGNLLVGDTSATFNDTAKTVIRPSADNWTIKAGVAHTFNRTGSDGDILEFYKTASTKVGSIGTVTDKIYIGSSAGGDTYLRLNSNTVTPANSSGADRDATINLGYSGGRFQNLFLSGGVYLGGTGSANKLDDYEEGTWTPTVEGSTTNPSGLSYSIQDGTYTKMGRMVYVAFRVRFSFTGGTGAGNLVIAGLSFTAANYAQPKSPPQHDNLSFTGFEYIEMSANANTATIGLAKNRSASTASSLALSDCNAGSTDINGGLFYFIA